MGFANNVALITGAGGDLGRGRAIRFAEEGVRIVVNDIDRKKANERVGLISVCSSNILSKNGGWKK